MQYTRFSTGFELLQAASGSARVVIQKKSSRTVSLDKLDLFCRPVSAKFYTVFPRNTLACHDSLTTGMLFLLARTYECIAIVVQKLAVPKTYEDSR